MPETGRCKHCKRERKLQGRGLCSPCYNKPDIREKYPAMTPRERVRLAGVKRDSIPDKAGPSNLPDRPTVAPPGTTTKLVEMAERARKGLALHHPGDETWENLTRDYRYRDPSPPEDGDD